KLIAPFAPGGPVDVVARLLAPRLGESLGQQFYVENHPGGSGNIGTALVAKAPPDGYTVLAISSTLVVNPSLFAKLGFDTTADLAGRRLAAGAAGASLRAGDQPTGAGRLGEARSRPAQLRPCRAWHAGLSRGRDAQASVRPRPGGRLLQRRRAGHHLDHRRPHA